jgi:aryl-alcohol dehydrogenase-like predicted oxidoreductase
MCPIVPMEEVVRAFNYVIEKGWVSAFLVNYVGFGLKSFKAFYWGTSEWSAEEIEEAHRMFFHLIPLF